MSTEYSKTRRAGHDASPQRQGAATSRTAQRLLVTGGHAGMSAPSVTLKHRLAEHGFSVALARGAEYRSTTEWIRLCRSAAAVVVLHFDGLDDFSLRQWAIPSAMGIPVVRWWIGTDVLNVLRDARAARLARIAQRFLARQVAVSPHLVEELATVNVSASFLPSLLDVGDEPGRPVEHVKSLLVYLPGDRREFYGDALVRKAVEANPAVEFVVLADDRHTLAGYPNVRSLGWVADLNAVWDGVGGLLRVTEHDGMPRMVLDALRRGKHVIYSWPLPGCVLARSEEEVLAAVAKFSTIKDINAAGIAAAEQLLTPDPAEQFARMLQEAIRERRAVRRIAATWTLVRQSWAVRERRRQRSTAAKPPGLPVEDHSSSGFA